jgi:hypothetical protein
MNKTEKKRNPEELTSKQRRRMQLTKGFNNTAIQVYNSLLKGRRVNPKPTGVGW